MQSARTRRLVPLATVGISAAAAAAAAGAAAVGMPIALADASFPAFAAKDILAGKSLGEPVGRFVEWDRGCPAPTTWAFLCL